MISVSAGNHAQALAWARGRRLDALLVMWQGARAPPRSPRPAATAPTVDLEAAGPRRRSSGSTS